MAITEAARHDLYNGLTDVLGPDRTEILMSALPLYALDEVATKADIALLRADIAPLSDRVMAVERKLDRLIFILITGLIGVIVTLLAGIGAALAG